MPGTSQTESARGRTAGSARERAVANDSTKADESERNTGREEAEGPGGWHRADGGDGLARALAAREALLRELEDRGAVPDSLPPLPELGAADEKSELPASTVAPASHGDSDTVAAEMAADIARLTDEARELAAHLEESRSDVERLRLACEERDRHIHDLEGELRESAAAQDNSPRDEHTAAQMVELERTYRELVAASERERRQHAEEVASLTQQISELRVRYESQIAELTNEFERRVDWPGQRDVRLPGADSKLSEAGERTAAIGSEVRASHDAVPGEPALLLVDDSAVGEQTERRLGKFGFPTLKLLAGRDVDAQFHDQSILCTAVNLALPSTWRALRALRTSVVTAATPMIAYILAPRAETGYWFGNVEFVSLPLRPDELAGSLQRLAKPLKHVILIGMEDKMVARIAKQLTAANITVTAALDRRDALNAVRGRYPQAAIVYPSQNPVDGFRAIAGIRGLAIFKDLPPLFLLDPTAVDREDERLSAGARTLLRLGSLKGTELVDQLASAMNTFKASSRNGS